MECSTMRVLGLALVLAVLGLLDYVAGQEEKLFTCATHRECHPVGVNCFCLKQPHHPRGECLCKLDPTILQNYNKNDCTYNSECSAKAVGSEQCFCAKESHQTIGKCKCIQSLLG